MDCIKCHAPLPDGAIFCPQCGKKQCKAKRVRHAKRSPALGSISRMPGARTKSYWARLPAGYAGCSALRQSIGCFATYAEADRALREALLKPPQGKTIPQTLQDIYDRFTESNYFDQLTKASQGTHKTAWKNLKPYANLPIASITKATFQDAVDAMQARKLKRETIAKVRNLASLLCKEAMGLGLLTINYGQLVQLPREDKTPQLPFSAAQLKLLWQTADSGDCDAMAVLIMCYTGMRPSELLGVDIAKHIQYSDDALYFKTGSKTDAGRDRIIPIAPLIQPLLQALIGGRESGALVTAPTGGACRLDNWRKRSFAPLMARLDISGCTPYTCRHTFADLQKRRHVDPEVMMVVMGHEDYSTTVEHYHTTTEDDIASLCNAFYDMTRPA